MDDATNIDGTYAFAGLTRYNDGDIPEKVRDHGSSLKWWAAETTGEDEPSADDLPEAGLNTLADRLPRATEATAGWKHPITGEWIETGMDWECVNSLRQITEGKLIKHAGDVEERVEWIELYEDLLEELDLKTDQLSQVIYEASEERLDLSALPDGFAGDYDSTLEALYAYSGLPDYLATVAADNARAEADDPFEPDWWTLHRGATYAISHEARGEVGSGSAIDQYNRVANEMLMNPAGMADTVEEAYEADQDDETLAEHGGGVASVATAFESVREKRDSYEEREEQIHSLIEG